MIAYLTTALLGLADPWLSLRIGVATTFGPSSVDTGNPHDGLACEHDRPLTLTDRCVASYALPCGSYVAILSLVTWRGAVLPVCDRGPRRTMRRSELQATDLDVSVGVGIEGAVMWFPIFN